MPAESAQPPAEPAPRGALAPVAVAVISFNTRDLLEGCLHSLAADARKGRAEVWVVDNASVDGSAAMVRESFPWVRLVANPDNRGFGAAVNQVALRTDTPWIAAANADIELTPGALERLLHAGMRPPGAAALAPRLLLADGSVQHSIHSFPTVRLALAFNLGIHRFVPGLGDRLGLLGYWDSNRPRRVDWAIGAFLLVRRSAWTQVGGFDPAQWMYAEDLDLGWRLDRAGWTTRFEPAAAVHHRASAATAAAWGEQRHERWLTSTYAWLLRRRGWWVARTVAVVNLAGAGVRWLTFDALARLAPTRFGPRRDAYGHWVDLHSRVGLSSARRLGRG